MNEQKNRIYHEIGADFVHVDIHVAVEATTSCQVAQHSARQDGEERMEVVTKNNYSCKNSVRLIMQATGTQVQYCCYENISVMT